MFVLLALLIPCLWVTYIWDQIIDPHYESDTIPIPDHRLLRCFYYASKKITGRFLLRTPIFIIIALLFVAFGVLDIVSISYAVLGMSLDSKSAEQVINNQTWLF